MRGATLLFSAKRHLTAQQTDCIMTNPSEILVGLDVGTEKVLCVVARPGEKTGLYRVEGYGLEKSEGIREGVVVDIEGVVTSIRKAIQEAQYTAQVPINEVFAAIGGSTLTSEDFVGTAVVRNREVSMNDVLNAEQNAREHSVRKDKELIKMLAQGYKCGDAYTDKPPIGLCADRVEALYHGVFGSLSNAENMRRCLQRSGLELVNYDPHPWAAAQAVLSETEKYCGTVVFDVGAQTTSIAIFDENKIRYTDVRPYGAEFFTRDIAVIFGLTMAQAEELKVSVGHCHPERVQRGETVQTPEHDGKASRLYSRELLAKTLRGRALEFFQLYKRALEEADMLKHVHCVVLTGGGANLVGLDVIAAETFGVPVRIGRPQYVEEPPTLLTRPEASVAMGLISSAGQTLSRGEEKRSDGKRLGWVKRLFTGDY